MTYYQDKGPEPKIGKFDGFHHVEFYVSNAKQVADWYCVRFGFDKVAYRGLETGCRDRVSHVIRQNEITYVFTSLLNPEKAENEVNNWIATRGDSAKDIAFKCDNVAGIWQNAVDKGAKSVMKPTKIEHPNDQGGYIMVAKLETYGGVVHSLVNDDTYKGVFYPGFRAVESVDPVCKLLPEVGLEFIDHIVGNQSLGEMDPVAQWYIDHLEFHRFWSVDDKQVHTQYSALKSVVVADWSEKIKMPINEPAIGQKKKSQIQEYVEYHGGAGVQHIAMNTKNILKAIPALRKRGMTFLQVPKTYYDDLRKRLANSPVNVTQDLDEIERLNILVDFDDQGYLLQLFTKPVQDRPTLFYEIIERHNNNGFGAGNFKALFEAIERDQDERGNLVDLEPEKETK